MPLFNHWPYVDLSKLNLDLILKKVKHIEDAEATADEVLEAAATIIPAIDQIHDDADRAEAAATAAAQSAVNASGSLHSCGISEQNAANSAQAALGHASQAFTAKEAAEAAQTAAEAAQSAAAGSATAADNSADAAADSAVTALNAATRAESAASTTGFRAYAGVIAVGVTKTLTLPDGAYLVSATGEDGANSSCIYFTAKNSSMLYSRNLLYNGNGDTMLTFGSTDTTLTIRNNLISGEVKYLVSGCEESIPI